MLGTLDPQTELLDSEAYCGHLVAEESIHRKLAQVGDALFTEEDFVDLYDPSRGRHSVPPSLLAKVLLLQSLEGTSDRETVDRVRRDIGWKVALHLPLQDEGFHPTVLVYFRERLRRSERPRRIFERFKEVATEAGLLSRRGIRVLDSTPVLSAVQTQDTVSLIRGAIRRLLSLLAKSAPETKLAVEASLSRQDYGEIGKPPIDWDDAAAREALVDELVRDANSALSVLEGAELPAQVAEAAELLATIAGQDVEETDDGRFCIRRGVARDRVISMVDPEARHGRKSVHGHFDGYKAHVAVEPETELITEVELTPANTTDAQPVPDLLPELEEDGDEEPLTVVGDTAYGTGPVREAMAAAGAELIAKAPPETNTRGGFPKSAFIIDPVTGRATCPAGQSTSRVMRRKSGERIFRFPAEVCAACPLRPECTSSPHGRQVVVGPHEPLLAHARARQRTPDFKAVYNQKRPIVERVISRLVRRGGRKARYRGREKVAAQLTLKAASENLLRMFRVGLGWDPETGWAIV
ncbi:MAG: IS1182 family transposase [Actinomycetota bacterium]